MKIYLLGYQNIKGGHNDLAALCRRLEATVIDIRLNPRSRVPHWNKGPLSRAADIPYQHCPELGNVNYKIGGEIKIQDFKKGLTFLQGVSGNVILMCACRDACTCHRTTVGAMLETEGYEVVELHPSLQQAGLLE
jgi:hypothetical protein